MNDAFENLLRNRQVWRAVNAANGGGSHEPATGLATGYPKLDRQLPGGGWPRHALTEILLEHYGTGELQLLMPALARLGQPSGGRDDRSPETGGPETGGEDGWIAWIAPPFQPYPPALLQWGIDLSRMLIVRPRRDSETLWAAEQAVSSGNCAAVLLWPSQLDHTASRRLQLAAAKGRCWAIAFRPLKALLQPSAAALRLRLSTGERGTDVGILKSRGGRPVTVRDYAE
ncbi:MAG TPA: hypothetical protein VMO24_00120 [Woeseiaceae bacterium]|nr:hypothetical protein [Woeseiaceae bacterium]